ncbi:MAG: glycoside hydrolase family 127 protein [Clostridia bacterium]|nr:glycoside hydrolase family 127 protein [Clostridia bacterium]
MKQQNPITLSSAHPAGFLADCQRLVRDVMLPYQYEVLCDRMPGVEKSGVMENFVNAGKALRGEPCGEFYGMVFQDSDAAKWIEAAACSLAVFPDAETERKADELIDLIAAAQDSDGYLNTFYTIKDRDKRWTNLLEGHELYCSGHMIEAACAYYEATGKRKLLDVVIRNAEHIYHVFIDEKHPGCPGHPEIELALLKLYRVTNDARFSELAAHFINVRGTDPAYFVNESKTRGWTVWGNTGEDGDYQQSGCPVREMDHATGHAVRAVYLYTAMADLAALTGDEALAGACRRLFDNITERQMYVTGGIGSTAHGEAFTVDYDLPSDTAYAETCASIGLCFFASRMGELQPDGRYADIMERAFYNTVLAGIQLDGKRFFYVNPLEVVPGIADKAVTHRHIKPERPGWYACACCPPNAARMIASFYRYAYGENETTAFCHLFAAGEIDFRNGMKLVCETGYPYDFSVTYRVSGQGQLAVRIPGWSRRTALTVNGVSFSLSPVCGYQYLTVHDGDTVVLTLDDRAQTIYASPLVPELTGRIALCRGPLIYCFEGIDNHGDVLSLAIPCGTEFRPVGAVKGLPDGITGLAASGMRMKSPGGLYHIGAPEWEPAELHAVPYYVWGNRGENQMRIWMNMISG